MGKHRIPPIPEGFADLAAKMTRDQLRVHYACATEHVSAWRKQLGIINVRHQRPMPEDFPEFAETLTVNRAACRWKTSTEAVQRWYAETGLTPMAVAGPKPVPEGFKAVCAQPIGELCKMYRASDPVVRRWREEVGYTPPPRQARMSRQSTKPVRAKGRPLPLTSTPQVDTTVAGQAAQHLRRFFSPVVKSEVIGKGKGQYLVGGKGLMPVADMVALAEVKGFDGRSWAKVI